MAEEGEQDARRLQAERRSRWGPPTFAPVTNYCQTDEGSPRAPPAGLSCYWCPVAVGFVDRMQ